MNPIKNPSVSKSVTNTSEMAGCRTSQIEIERDFGKMISNVFT
jgi:hypothetical protein